MTRSALVRLGWFALASSVGVSALALALPGGPERETTRPSTLHYSHSWLRGDARDDSWHPMRRAREILQTPGRRSLYERTWFRKRIKFQYPPTSLLWMAPLERISADGTSDGVLNGVSRLAVLAVALVVARILVLRVRAARSPGVRVGRGEELALFALAVFLALTFYPLVRSFFLGQIQTWIDLLVCLLVWAWISGHRATAGVFAGIACAIKPPLALLWVWAALRGHWRFAAGLAGAAGLALALSLWAYGLENHWDYLRVLGVLSRQGESYYPNQSVNGLLHRLLFNGPNLTWQPHRFAPYHPVVFLGTALSSALLVAAALFWRRPRTSRVELEDLLIALWSFTLASPVVWEHHYGVSLPIFAAALPATAVAARGRPLPLIALAAAYVAIGNDFSGVHALAATPWNFLQSFTLFGGIALLASLYWLRSAREPSATEEPSRSA